MERDLLYLTDVNTFFNSKVNYLFIIDFIFLRRYGKHNLVLIIICLIILLFSEYYRRVKLKKQKEEEKQFKNVLKTEGIKITISSDKCEVIDKVYTVPNPYLRKMEYRRPSMADYIFDKVNYDEYIEVKECYIECGAKINNRKKAFKSDAIKMDTKTLEIKLYMKKEIDIYYNPNTEEYFFDLDFLDT